MNAFKKMYNPNQILMIGDGGIAWKEFLSLNLNELF
jgi:hypothetical protein